MLCTSRKTTQFIKLYIDNRDDNSFIIVMMMMMMTMMMMMMVVVAAVVEVVVPMMMMTQDQNCDQLVTNATENLVLATRITRLVTRGRLTFSALSMF